MNSTTDPLADVPLSVIGGTLQLLRYVSIVSPVVATYDCLLTLDDEVCPSSHLSLRPPPYRLLPDPLHLARVPYPPEGAVLH